MINKKNKAKKHNIIYFAVNYSFTFNFITLLYVQFEAKFMIFRFLKFSKVR